jgi:hypothetical protein
MSDGNPRNQEVRSNTSASDGLRGCQFSLASIFVVMTAMAVILSIFFTVGQLVGMSTGEVLVQGLSPLLSLLPSLLVWIVGLTMALRRLKRNRMAAILTMIALGVLAVVSFVFQLIQMAAMHSVLSGGMSHQGKYWIIWCDGILGWIVQPTCWILILTAIFHHRPPDVSETELTAPSVDPLLTNEPAPIGDGQSNER